MQFFDWLGQLVTDPQAVIDAVNLAVGEWWSALMTTMATGITTFVINSVAVCVICYAVYCAFGIMFSNKSETFSAYINKSMVAAVVYFIVKCGGTMILNALIGG